MPKISDEALDRLADVVLLEAKRLADERASCAFCGKALRFATEGRPPVYCDSVCRKAAFRSRKAEAR